MIELRQAILKLWQSPPEITITLTPQQVLRFYERPVTKTPYLCEMLISLKAYTLGTITVIAEKIHSPYVSGLPGKRGRVASQKWSISWHLLTVLIFVLFPICYKSRGYSRDFWTVTITLKFHKSWNGFFQCFFSEIPRI